jgi:hypothetical protein
MGLAFLNQCNILVGQSDTFDVLPPPILPLCHRADVGRERRFGPWRQIISYLEIS